MELNAKKNLRERERKLTRLGGPALLSTLDTLRKGVVDGEDAAVELGAIHVVHGGGGVFFLEESDETERAVLLSGLIQGSLDVFDVAEWNEGRVENRLVDFLR